MNKFLERRKYFKDFNANTEFNKLIKNIDKNIIIIEENFIVECVKNENAMNFINKNCNARNFKSKNDYINKLRLDVIFRSCYMKIEDAINVLNFMSNTDDNLDLLRSVCIRLLKDEFKFIESNRKIRKQIAYKNSLLILFSLAFLNIDINFDENFNFIDEVSDEQIGLLKEHSELMPSKKFSEKLKDTYSEILSDLKIKKGKTLNNIGEELQTRKLLNMEKNSLCDINSYDAIELVNAIKIEDKKLKEKYDSGKNLKREDFLYGIVMKKLDMINHNFNFYPQILNFKITQEIIDVSLITTDFVKRTSIITDSFEELFLECLISNVTNKIASIILENSIKISHKRVIEDELLNKTISDKNKELEEIKKELEPLQNRLKLLEEENAKLKNESIQFKRNNERLKKSQEKDFNDKKELESLREFIFNLNIEDDAFFETEDTNKSLEKINLNDINQKIAFIGADENLHNKIKKRIDNMTYITVSEISRDLKFLRNMDKIIIHIHMQHSLYYKVIEIIKNSDIEIMYLKSTNVDIIFNKVKKFIEN